MNKIICAIMVSLSGTCFLKGEIAPPETEWKGGRLIYDGVSIKNEVTLPQKGVMYHDEDRLSFNITDATITMSTRLTKDPKCGREWCYKGIDRIVVKYCGDISDPDDGGPSISSPPIITTSGLMPASMDNGELFFPGFISSPASRMRILRIQRTTASAERMAASSSSTWKR